jgi:enterochelin esterase family protein
MNSAPARLVLKLCLFLVPGLLQAQVPAYSPLTVNHLDRSVTFHYKDDGGTTVLLGLEGLEKPVPMTKDAGGIWTVTTKPLAPEIYMYHHRGGWPASS